MKQQFEFILVQANQNEKMSFCVFVFAIYFSAICWSFHETVISNGKWIFHLKAKTGHSDNFKAFFLNLFQMKTFFFLPYLVKVFIWMPSVLEPTVMFALKVVPVIMCQKSGLEEHVDLPWIFWPYYFLICHPDGRSYQNPYSCGLHGLDFCHFSTFWSRTICCF